MTSRIEEAEAARARAATHAHLGRSDRAAQAIANAERYEAMTDAEYERHTLARNATISGLAAELWAKQPR